jgi:hypothetical protein
MKEEITQTVLMLPVAFEVIKTTYEELYKAMLNGLISKHHLDSPPTNQCVPNTNLFLMGRNGRYQ